MASTGVENPFWDHEDAYGDMMARRHINESFAERPVDFNVEGLRLAQKYLSLQPGDKILDVGCSSGLPILEAAKITGTKAEIIGLEPNADDYYYLPPSVDRSRFTFVVGYGEEIPLSDDEVRATSAHNVLFRAKDKIRMINEMKRVTEPGGLLLISTNARYHAFWRHTFERVVAKSISPEVPGGVEPAPIPAEGCYLEELPSILAEAGGLEVMEWATQSSVARITRDRLESYVKPITFSANRTNLHQKPELRPHWRERVDDIVVPWITSEIDAWERIHQAKGEDYPPYFADLILRGMVAVKNMK